MNFKYTGTLIEVDLRMPLWDFTSFCMLFEFLYKLYI